MKSSKRLSLLEIVIIAVLLGIISKAVVPRISQAGEEKKIQQLVEDLQRMRTCLDLYIAQHENQLPPTSSYESFARALTKKKGIYGPYIDQIPTNPFNGLNTIRFNGLPAGSNLAGWRLDTDSGLIQADNGANYADL